MVFRWSTVFTLFSSDRLVYVYNFAMHAACSHIKYTHFVLARIKIERVVGDLEDTCMSMTATIDKSLFIDTRYLEKLY